MFVDTLTHPTLNGKWIDNREGDTFEDLYKLAKSHNVISCCAVGLPEVGDYDHKGYYEKAASFNDFFYPVAPITKTNIVDIINEIDDIKTIGFDAIKIHQRLLRKNFSHEDLSKIFKKCYECNMKVFYCTYFHCHTSKIPNEDPFFTLASALKNSPQIKIILLHGGGVELLKYCELARFNENILIDLSLTLMKYDGSSIDKDILFLFNNFDRKITIGSDHPEWDYGNILKKLRHMLSNISEEKAKNITSVNALRFLDYT